MKLCGELVSYSGVTMTCVPFRVAVTACIATIVPPSADIIPDQFTMWYSAVDPVLDLSFALSQFTQQPNCGYEFEFDLQYEKFPVQQPGTLYALPPEAIYSSFDQTVRLQKCSPLANPNFTDSECQGTPKDKTLSFVVVARLRNDPMNQRSSYVKFDFQIGDVCT